MKWQAGQSGNPGGRVKRDREVELLAREHTANAIATLAAIMADAKVAPSSRVAAASALLERGWGKPVQPVEAGDGEPVRFVMLGVAEAESPEAWISQHTAGMA